MITVEVRVYQLPCLLVISGVDGDLTDHIAHLRMVKQHRSYAIPNIIKREECFYTHFAFLIHGLHKSPAELNGVR